MRSRFWFIGIIGLSVLFSLTNNVSGVEKMDRQYRLGIVAQAMGYYYPAQLGK